ncbi:hypothetical protein D9M72_507080 [compost metagenome]
MLDHFLLSSAEGGIAVDALENIEGIADAFGFEQARGGGGLCVRHGIAFVGRAVWGLGGADANCSDGERKTPLTLPSPRKRGESAPRLRQAVSIPFHWDPLHFQSVATITRMCL